MHIHIHWLLHDTQKEGPTSWRHSRGTERDSLQSVNPDKKDRHKTGTDKKKTSAPCRENTDVWWESVLPVCWLMWLRQCQEKMTVSSELYHERKGLSRDVSGHLVWSKVENNTSWAKTFLGRTSYRCLEQWQSICCCVGATVAAMKYHRKDRRQSKNLFYTAFYNSL